MNAVKTAITKFGVDISKVVGLGSDGSQHDGQRTQCDQWPAPARKSIPFLSVCSA